MGRRRNLEYEIVTWDNSIEWGSIWGHLPDPDVVLRDTGLDVAVFDSLLADAHVFACYQSRKAGVLTSEYRIDYPKGAERTSKYFEELFRLLNIEDVAAQFLDAPFYGFSVNEIIWKVINGQYFPVEVAQKPNDWFVWNKNNELRFLSRKDQENGELIPANKVIVVRHFSTYKNPYGLRVLSRCFWPVAFKKGGNKYWMQWMEKFGIPWLIGKVPRGTTAEQRDALLENLATMVQSAAAVINDDETIETLDGGRGQSNRSNNIYMEMVNNANAEISKAILTQTLTTEIGEKGAYAASQSHLEVRNDLCEMDKKLVAVAFNQLFSLCCELNFSGMVPPVFTWIREEDPKESYSRRDSNLVSQGVRFSEDYYARQYNLRKDEFRVEEPESVGSLEAPGKQKDNEQVQNKRRQDERLKKRKEPKKETDE